jgi:diacylglycerol kinase (ATP)
MPPQQQQRVNKPKAKGLKRLANAAIFSKQGLKATWQSEEAFRLDVWLFLVLTPVAFWLGKTGLEQSILIICLVLVILCELINSALEAIVDRISDELHPLSGMAKDIGSALVLISCSLTILVWGLIAWDHLI